VLGAAGAPRAAAAQKTGHTVGFLNSTTPGAAEPLVAAFRAGLAETGHVEGRDVTIAYRWAEGHYDRLPALAADLVRARPDVIVTSGGDVSAQAAKAATSTIPIVSTIGGDPIATKLVASLARPGGNLTGVSFLTVDLTPKRLEIISQLVPGIASVALLVNATSPQTSRVLNEVEGAARAMGMTLEIVKAGTEAQIDAAFAALAKLRVGALLVQADPYFIARREQLVALTARNSLPAIYEWRGFAEAGGLVSYGTSLAGVYHQVGAYTGMVLNGSKPADLPVLQPTKFELVLNVATAKALGLAVPASIVAGADDLIE
jgi:putative ABC transport system substrate-binding protein